MQWYQGEVVDIIKETKNIRRFFIRVNSLDKYDFLAGQHVKIEFPISSKKNYRQYSIANAPDGSNIFELLIVLDPNGLATNYLFNEVRIGSFLKVSEPRGNFVLNENITADLCFLCTGVGLAPLRSMYLEIFKKNLSNRKMYLIFGTRFMEDMIYLDEMQELSKNYNFEFIPVLSRESSSDWQGKRGYVHQIYQEIFENRKDVEFYICGWRDMVSQARINLLNMGFARKQIHFERYD